MFAAVRALNRKPFQNPTVHDPDGKRVTKPQELHNLLKDHFSDHFYKNGEVRTSERAKCKLETPISITEVRESVSRMKNRRAPGYQKINVELIKYGPPELLEAICDFLNGHFEGKNEIILGKGILTPLQKPGKPRGPLKNIRPVILLPTIRKILSIITLKRMKNHTEAFLSPSQSAYRPGRSTTDIVWAYRWIVARIMKCKETVHITAVDMSSAFDTIKRNHLVNVIDHISNDDNARMTEALVSNTSLEVKIDGVVTADVFETNMGSPQGDALSGTLFDVYLEDALTDTRDSLEKYEDHTYHTDDQTCLQKQYMRMTPIS
jgi:hypothetical protein